MINFMNYIPFFLIDNIYSKKMTYEEVSVLLDTFNIAQKHYINSQK